MLSDREKNALYKSIKHWKHNLEVVRGLDEDKFLNPIYMDSHEFTERVLGIHVDTEHCPLCQLHLYSDGTVDCDSCCLYDRNTPCCNEWLVVWQIIRRLRFMNASTDELATAIEQMIKRLEGLL